MYGAYAYGQPYWGEGPALVTPPPIASISLSADGEYIPVLDHNGEYLPILAHDGEYVTTIDADGEGE